jgi:hypothetical protein
MNPMKEIGERAPETEATPPEEPIKYHEAILALLPTGFYDPYYLKEQRASWERAWNPVIEDERGESL